VYVWIWRTLPGNWAAKLAGSLLLLAGALAVLFFAVFPFVEPRLPWNNVNVDRPAKTDQPNVAHSGLVRLSPNSTVVIPALPSTTAWRA
jgi:hypothetical protein